MMNRGERVAVLIDGCCYCGVSLYQDKRRPNRSPYCPKLECRLYGRVEKVGTCWRFTGAKHSRKGYGSIGVSAGHAEPAHIISFKLGGGKLSKQKPHVLHHPTKCKFKDCINPKHLRAGSNAENVRDREISGTTARGDKNGRTKLTERQVKLVRRLARFSIRTQGEIGAYFGVSDSTVSLILNGSIRT